jgi:hypothetical protein
VLGRSGECSNQNPQGGGLFFEREQERERGEDFLWFGKEKGGNRLISSRPRTHQRATCADSPRRPCGRSARCADGLRGERTVRHPGADGPLFAPERPVLPLFPASRADSPRRPGGRSARSGRTIRPTATDSPTFLYIFSLIYSEINI